MEDGNCYQVQTDNLISPADIRGRKPSPQGNDKYYNLNGNGEGRPKLSKQCLSDNDFVKKSENLNCIDTNEDSSSRPSKKKPVPVNSDLLGNNHLLKSSKKPFNQPFKTTKFKGDKSKGFSEDRNSPQTLKENGNHLEYKRPLPSQVTKYSQPNKTARAFHGVKNKYSHRRTKHDGSQLTEYAQYLGLQPTIKFKCSKCCCTSFESLGMLKEHQRSCSSQASTTEASAVAHVPTHSGNNANFRITRKVYLCSACGTYYENWNLFLHIREVHNRHICLFCLGMFSQAHKLASHLVIKHNIQENHFTSKEDLFSKFSESFYLMCCKCEKVFTERENFIVHECTQAVKYCSVCKLRGSHKVDCPKNSKHKLPIAQPQLEFKKMKRTANKNPLGHTDRDPIDSTSPSENSLPSTVTTGDSVCAAVKEKCDILSDRLDTKDSSDIERSPSPLQKSELSNSYSPILQDENLNNKFKFSPIDTREEVSMQNSELSSELITGQVEKSQEPNFVEHVETDNKIEAEHSPFQESIVKPLLDVNLPNPELKSINSSQNSIDSSNMNKDILKTVLKPPARNRRPPKRYQVKDTAIEFLNEEVTEHKPIVDLEPIVNKVPKLTVKVPKLLTEKESTSDYSSESEDSDKLTVDYDMGPDAESYDNPLSENVDVQNDLPQTSVASESMKTDPSGAEPEIAVAGDDIPITELTLDQPLDRFPLRNLLKVFLNATNYNCIYCNHARKIAVNGRQLSLHFIAQHRFSATVDSITAEELLPETIVTKIRSCLNEVQNIYLNMEGFDSVENDNMKFYDHTYECFQCYMITTVHKELYLHNRKMHQKTILLCIMCKSNFYSYSELLCHLCPGMYVINSEIRFRCCLCELDSIPSAFRLMVHLRKRHHACDVCLETCHNQSKLSNHVWKHKLHHLCYRCGIAYRNKPDITKHLFWKHGTESVLCKKCLQKKWPHVYHFCIPPNTFVCEECNLNFTKAVSLKVHKRIHSGDSPYACTQENCTEKFISKKLFLKHEMGHLEPSNAQEEPLLNVVSLAEENIEKVPAIPIDIKDSDSIMDNQEPKVTPVKVKKPKKNKKHKDSKDNLLIDVNLPALNLSESDSSDESEPEVTKKLDSIDITSELDDDTPAILDVQLKTENMEDPKPEPPVAGIWDNFQIYQAEIQKSSVDHVQAPSVKPHHVCESDHDYCVIPSEEVLDKENLLEIKEESPIRKSSSNKENRKKLKSKKKSIKKSSVSSSSDSSSESDSSCSCGTNCSCSSSSNSSSSSSSSSDSDLSSSALHREKPPVHKDSDASHTSAVDIMATEESPCALIPDPKEIPVAESDLDTDETETDEDFYDEHPQRLANKILAEKRNQLMLLATVAPINNGSHMDSSRPPSPEEPAETIRKKIKTKKKKKEKKSVPVESLPKPNILSPKINIPVEDSIQASVTNKITISLQSNTVQVIDQSNMSNLLKPSVMSKSESDKRASKRRRVPNRFYGYSSDEEYLLKPQLPPKLEWRKEDLPSPSGPPIPQLCLTERPYSPAVDNISQHSEPVLSPKLIPSEPTYVSSDDSDSSKEGVLQINHPYAQQTEPEPPPILNQFPGMSRPLGSFPFPRPAGARQAREGESVYCYCRCPYDEVSEMIACDGDGCNIEWFHFECVGIMVPPKGKWFCPDCRQRLENSEI